MKIKQSDFKTIIENIPSIEVELVFEGTEGTATIEDKSIEIPPFTLSTSFSCYESGTFDAGDYMTPPSFSSNGLDIYDVEVLIYNKDGEELILSPEQNKQLIKIIESSIISN